MSEVSNGPLASSKICLFSSGSSAAAIFIGLALTGLVDARWYTGDGAAFGLAGAAGGALYQRWQEVADQSRLRVDQGQGTGMVDCVVAIAQRYFQPGKSQVVAEALKLLPLAGGDNHFYILWPEGEDESMFLSDSAASEDGMGALRASSITSRIATGKHAGHKVVTLQTLPGDAGLLQGEAGKVDGFSLHAGVA